MKLETQNVVDGLKTELETLAKQKTIGIRFTQANHNGYTCTSRVYFYNGDLPQNVNSLNVIESFEWSQARDAGTTNRCARYRAYIDAMNFLKNLDTK